MRTGNEIIPEADISVVVAKDFVPSGTSEHLIRGVP